MKLLRTAKNTLFVMVSALLLLLPMSSYAQRHTDQLDRGLVAVKTDVGVFCSWRILGEEYYDVAYNIYRDGKKLNETPLTVSNFVDAGGSVDSRYTVTAVVRGKEQGQSKDTGVWLQKWLEIKMDHGDLKSTYVPNDACCADVDGDGELEMLLKFDNLSEINASYPKGGWQGEYSIVEVYKLDGRKLWWLDFGPNMGDFQNNEQNIVAYDWDEDGKAEAVMRAADGTTIHMADGTVYVVGDATKNYRGATGGGANWFMHDGAEYLVYMEGATGKPYQVMDFPLKRLEAGETDLEAAWGDGYGHRSSKYFFGAPCLDGRHHSIFLARGIYTRHKMIAYDVDPATHALTERWRWNNNTAGSVWFGQGYHNYAVADVDWDGRDEICFGSMVIDDNGKGLSTTGLGHGDAQHHGDFNPYIHGQEIFACNEDNPGNNYRDATTSKIYYRYVAGKDDGRAMMGNFSNDYPGCQGVSSRDPGLISSVINGALKGGSKNNITQNFRIYWDGDLLEETHDYSNGKNTAIAIYKYGKGTIQTLTGSMTNNDTKGTPCYQGDLFGDWREEIIARTAQNNIRIYTTAIPTKWRNYTLWHDHQYRNAMVWQMCGYNQPPHVSYFLGELEGITQAPPALTMAGRTEVGNGGTISQKDGQVITCETADMTVSVSDGASPYVYIDNAPSWVQGKNSSSTTSPDIFYETFTHTLTGGSFAGDMRLVKQGDGTLVLPKVTETYNGPTDVWAGTLCFDGTMQNSRVWLNRFAVLTSDGGRFMKGIQMDYASMLVPGGLTKTGTVETDSLLLGFGARVILDVDEEGTSDLLKVRVLSIEKKTWQNGPEYQSPVFQIVQNGTLKEGKYLLAEVETVIGEIGDLALEGISGLKASLVYEEGKLYLDISAMRQPTEVSWDGGSNGIWDLATTENFKMKDGSKDIFVTNDIVTFGDGSSSPAVTVSEDVSPASIIFDNSTTEYTLNGDGCIIGKGSLTKRGTGRVVIRNTNKFSGGTVIEEGTLNISSLANSDGSAYGALGGVSDLITLNGGTLSVNNSIVSSQPIKVEAEGGTLSVFSGKNLTLKGNISATKKPALHKIGAGTLTIGGTVRCGALYIDQGVVQGGENGSNVHQYPDTVVINGGSLKDPDNMYSYSSNSTTVVVPEDKKGSWTLDGRCDYKGKLLGKGELTVNVTSVRSNMTGDWSQFAGTLIFKKTKTGSYEPSLQWNNSKGLGNATVQGVFNNNGKNVAIGTLKGDATLEGSGTYSVAHLVGQITKSGSKSENSFWEVAGSLTVTGDITISLVGGKPKIGEEFVLWSAKNFSVGKSVTVTLPELPKGLAWDSSELLKKNGVLKVVEATSIAEERNVRFDDAPDVWYTLDGRRLSGQPTAPGIYIYKGKKVRK